MNGIQERPMLFKASMVRAVLGHRKTQTRRDITRIKGFKCTEFGPSTTDGYDWHFRCQRGLWQDMRHEEVLSRCPYGQVGDRLWVRETWAVGNIYDEQKPSEICREILDRERICHGRWQLVSSYDSDAKIIALIFAAMVEFETDLLRDLFLVDGLPFGNGYSPVNRN